MSINPDKEPTTTPLDEVQSEDEPKREPENEKEIEEEIASAREFAPGEVKKDDEEKERVSILKTEMLKRFNEMIDSLGDAPHTGEIKPENKEKVDIAYGAIKGFFIEITGEDLNSKIKNEAKKEAEAQGRKIISKKEFFKVENVAKMEKKFRGDRCYVAIKERWVELSDKEKQLYGGEMRNFANRLDQKRQDLEKKGILFSEDVFYTLLREGYNPQDIKKKGWFGNQMIVPSKGGDKVMKIDSQKDLQEWTAKIQANFDSTVKKEAQTKMEKDYQEGRARWMTRKIKKASEIITEIASVSEEEKPTEVATAPEEVIAVPTEVATAPEEVIAVPTEVATAPEEIPISEAALIEEEKKNEKITEERQGALNSLGEEISEKLNLTKTQKSGLLMFIKRGARADKDKAASFIPQEIVDAIDEKAAAILSDDFKQRSILSRKRLELEKIKRQKMVKDIETRLSFI